MKVEKIENEMHEQFDRAGLLPFLIEDSSSITDVDGELLADVVLNDGAKVDQVTELMSDLLKGTEHSLVVRPQWSVQIVHEPTFYYASTGSPVPATFILVDLRAGTETATVTVMVTKLAQMELEFILGRKPDLKQVAKLKVESSLRPSGASAWNPLIEPNLEVASGAAANFSRLLKKTA